MRTFLNTWHNMGVVALQNSRIATQTFLLGKQTEEEREGGGGWSQSQVESGAMIRRKRPHEDCTQKGSDWSQPENERLRVFDTWSESQRIGLMRSQSQRLLYWRETSRGSLNVCEPSPKLGVVEWIVCETRQSIVGYRVQAIWSETCASETVMAKLVGMRWRYKREKRMEISRHMKVQVRA